jgi:hypothetical protein
MVKTHFIIVNFIILKIKVVDAGLLIECGIAS